MGNLPPSGQLERVARAARVAGIITLVLGAMTGGVLILMTVRLSDAGSHMPPRLFAASAIMLFAVYVVPGALIWWLGRRLDAGSYWAFIPILVVAVLVCATVLFGYTKKLVGGAVLFPMIYALVIWTCGVSDYLDYLRQRRRRRERRGFDVVASGSPDNLGVPRLTPKPSPPARVPPRPRL